MTNRLNEKSLTSSSKPAAFLHRTNLSNTKNIEFVITNPKIVTMESSSCGRSVNVRLEASHLTLNGTWIFQNVSNI